MKLYAVWEEYVSRKPVLCEVEAIETKLTYRLVDRSAEGLPAFGYARRLEKSSKLAALSPEEAWANYVSQKLRAMSLAEAAYHECRNDYYKAELALQAWREANREDPKS